ncbi:hypothetical protein SLEP1_g41131 [Rubroshorea leprosula]|uniref:Uncharacterized protein n=1 Tax=Rubroshorea leprosula TaxID=152421 RepID=A0AAV5L649_9ROSI|nr:hypothetical protein SLEP1_g41131 [Rubroshorea leprosula]
MLILYEILQAAKEAAAFREDKIKLEKEVEELTLHLQLEKQMRSDLEKEIQLQSQENV